MHRTFNVGWRPSRLERWRSLAASLAICLGALFIFVEFGAQATDYHSIAKHIWHIPLYALAFCLCLTAVSFLPVLGREIVVVRLAGARPPLRAVLLACLCGAALDNAVGLKSLKGTVIRRYLYKTVGLGQEQIERLLSVLTQNGAAGLVVFIGIANVVNASVLGEALGLPAALFAIGGLVLIAGSAGVFAKALRGNKRQGRATFAKSVGDTLQVICSAYALWTLFPTFKFGFVAFAAVFVTAGLIGAASQLPGGIGVFEAVILLGLSGKLPAATIVSTLIVFRVIYFMTPLVVASSVLAGYAWKPGRLFRPDLSASRFARNAARLAPRFLGVEAFLAGGLLVISGATPTFGGRLETLSLYLPLWVVEASHFLGSLIGVLFIFVSRGLFGRRETAWWAALILAMASLLFSLAKGLAYGEVIFLGTLIALLLAARSQFRGSASFQSQSPTAGLVIAVGIVIAASFSILLFAFQDVSYTTRDFWWQFEFDAQAPRALRAMVGVSVLALILSTWELLRAPKGIAPRPAPETLAKAAEIIRSQDRSDALLALMGDKSFLFSKSGRAFLMYSKRGRSWIALYDPIGPQCDWPELINDFLKLAATHGGRVAFYQVRPANLPIYLEAGLSIIKLGEEARVDLASFTLEGGSRSNLRYALKRGAREGLVFELLDPNLSPSVLAELEAVSDDWLRSRRVEEKSFSIAAFHRPYIQSQFIAAVRQNGQLVAFATFMATANRREATVGLMRHIRKAPNVAMEYLFTRLILALREQGYLMLDLGMAPFSGLRAAPLTSFWHRLGALIWQHANPIYNFQGLRLFKGKFGPSWEPRYLAASGTVGPFVALADAAALIGKRFRRMGEA